MGTGYVDAGRGPRGRRGRTRREHVALLAGGVAALGAACAPGQTAPAEVRERAPVTLRDQRATTPGSAVELSDAAIKAKYPWLTVVHEGGGSSSFDAMAKLVVDAAAGTLPDIIYAQGTQIQYYISQKIVISMTPYLTRDKAFDVADFPKVELDTIWAEEMKPLWAQTTSVKDMLGTVAKRMAPVLEKNKAGF
jgi:ABC-type glycerol-3-phosphate transport system substrate-binding protein